jgi:hypothetical protein
MNEKADWEDFWNEETNPAAAENAQGSEGSNALFAFTFFAMSAANFSTAGAIILFAISAIVFASIVTVLQ